MINVYKIRRHGAFLFVGLFTVIFFYVGLVFYGFFIALVTMFAGLLTGMLIGGLLVKTPFRSMLEGRGVLVMDINSTGIIRFSTVGLKSPYVKGKLGGKKISDIWDRATVMQIEAPQKNKSKAEKNSMGGIKIDIDEKDYNNARFSLLHYPVLIWNDQIESLVTKDFLAEKEKGTFAEHGILFLNRRIEELTSQIRDFARYVVETSKPRKNFFSSPWVWAVAIFLIVILALLFMPAIIDSMQVMMGSTKAATGAATSGNLITPR